jgi:hypothetical protein
VKRVWRRFLPRLSKERLCYAHFRTEEAVTRAAANSMGLAAILALFAANHFAQSAYVAVLDERLAMVVVCGLGCLMYLGIAAQQGRRWATFRRFEVMTEEQRRAWREAHANERGLQ